MVWAQHYDPLGNLLLSALVASLPVVLLLVLLAFYHVKAHWAAIAGLAAAMLIAMLIYGMPIKLALSAAMFGGMYGLLPIGWIVVSAIFVYEITVATGQFEVLRARIAGLTDDRRLQVLLIAFSFGAFIEGAAGFGTPVAISAAMLIGLGFKPLPAAGLALIGNTAPVAFGALGTPIIALANVTGLNLQLLSQMVGRQLPLFSLLVPFWLVWSMVGWRGMLQVWPACLTAGASFGLVQFAVSNFHGPWLVDIAGSVSSILALVMLVQVWQPPALSREQVEHLVNIDDDSKARSAASSKSSSEIPAPRPVAGSTVRAIMPWILLTVMVTLWGIPAIKQILDKATVPLKIASLHLQVERMPPVVEQPEAEKAEFKVNWLSSTGTALFVTGILSGLLLRMSMLTIINIFLRTVQRTALSLITIVAMLALGFTTRYSGLDATMGLAMASTGWLFPFFSPMLGWLGVALTGSDTSSNILFGNLQQITATHLGLSPLLAAASNSSGGVMGKMIDAQSIVVAGVATGQHGNEGAILRYVFFHSLVLAMLVGVLVTLQAYVFSWMIPT